MRFTETHNALIGRELFDFPMVSYVLTKSIARLWFLLVLHVSYNFMDRENAEKLKPIKRKNSHIFADLLLLLLPLECNMENRVQFLIHLISLSLWAHFGDIAITMQRKWTIDICVIRY